MTFSDVSALIGARVGDAEDIRVCRTKGYLAIPAGVQVTDFDEPDRAVPSPPQVEGGPFGEMRLAPNPEAGLVAAIGRLRIGSEQPIWQIVANVLGFAVHAVVATGVRIKDRHADSRLVGGTPGLRKEGEHARAALLAENRKQSQGVDWDLGHPAVETTVEREEAGPMSNEWATLDAYFREDVAAVEVPADSGFRSIDLDWSLVVPTPRLAALDKDGPLTFIYLGTSIVRFRDLFKVRDVNGQPAGGRFAYYLGRELAHDIFSVRRQHGFKQWLRFSTATLSFASSLGGIGWLLSGLTSALA